MESQMDNNDIPENYKEFTESKARDIKENLEEYWYDPKYTINEIADRFDVYYSRVQAEGKKMGFTPRPYPERKDKVYNDPTPKEIKEMCEAIRNGWSDTERNSRHIGARRQSAQLKNFLYDSHTGIFRETSELL